MKYAVSQLNEFRPDVIRDKDDSEIPAWNSDHDFPQFADTGWLKLLEDHGVFFSYPLDLDLMLLDAYPDAYNVVRMTPTQTRKKAVLGKACFNADRLGDEYLQLFDEYHRQFNSRSKPARHIAAMSKLTDEELLGALPDPLQRLVKALQERLESIPE